jgi:glycosyltransferase involved in cell wall biosynthesis
MNKLFFSIIIPVYNVAGYINRCLDSIYCQDFCAKNFEIIIINDGSTDNSQKVIEDYIDKSINNIKLINQDNKGVSSARNEGIKKALGEYIIFIDPDDSIFKNSLKETYNYLIDKKSQILILNSYETKKNTTVILKEIFPVPKSLIDCNLKGIDIHNCYYRGSVWGVIYSNEFIKNNNIHFNENLKNGEDALFFSICLIYAESVSYSNIDFYLLHSRSGSASNSWSKERLLSFALGLNEISLTINQQRISKEQSSILYSLAFRFISHLYYRLFQLKNNRRKLHKKIKHICINSGIYPIKIQFIVRQRLQIRLLNFSYNLFVFVFVIREIFNNHFLKKN